MTDQEYQIFTALVADLRQRAEANLPVATDRDAPEMRGFSEGLATAAGLIEQTLSTLKGTE